MWDVQSIVGKNNMNHKCEGIDCINKNRVISFSEFVYSAEKYRKPLCMDCQNRLLLKEEPRFAKFIKTNSNG